MFMVVMRHSRDDIPYRLCKTRDEAEAVVRECLEEPEAPASARECVWRSVTPWGAELGWWIYEFDGNGELVGGDCICGAEDIPPPSVTKTLRPEDLKGIPRD